MACHNRRAQTLAALARLGDERVDSKMCVYLVDDGSSDGTADAVRAAHPWVQVIRGDGNLFWAGGTRCAEDHARPLEPDFLLWLNDDVLLYAGALRRLLAVHDDLALRRDAPLIVVGPIREPGSDAVSYGGVRRVTGRRRLRFGRMERADFPQRCDTMNGNFVLISRAASDRTGPIDPVFVHRMADFDFGLRATAAGVEIWAAPGTHGECARHDVRRMGGLREEARLLGRPPHGVPFRGWVAFCRRHAGRQWPLYVPLPFVRHLSEAGRQSLRRARGAER